MKGLEIKQAHDCWLVKATASGKVVKVCYSEAEAKAWIAIIDECYKA